MAKPYPFHTLDVFTATRFAGNPLAVVTADDMSDTTMQAVAAEFGLSETVFVMAPENPEHEARVRIFTPVHEMPFAGHPTIGCAIHLAERRWPKGALDEVLVLEEEAGPVPVRVVREGAGRVTATFTAPVLPRAMSGTFERETVAAALGLNATDIRADHPIVAHEGGPSFLYVPLASVEALAHARVSEPAWTAVMRRDPPRPGANERDATYCYAPDPDGTGAAPDGTGAAPDGTGAAPDGTEGTLAYRARMFSPGGGTPEDPGTGSASAILAGHLLLAGELKEGTNRIALRQGIEMGRPCEIGVEADVARGALTAVRVSGTAVRVMDGRIVA